MLAARVLRQSVLQPQLLRTLFLFEALSDESLKQLADNGDVTDYDTGLIIGEGEPARYFHVLVDGEISLSKRSTSRDVETMRTSHRGAYCGATASYIENPPATYGFSVRATRPSQLVRIDARYLGDFIRTNYPLAVHLLQGMHVDHEGVHSIIDQQHRIQAAGTLTAGLMHGLNNPVAAITRIASHLSSITLAGRSFRIFDTLSPEAAARYAVLRSEVADKLQDHKVTASALDRIQSEEEIDDWLTNHQFARSWELAPTLAAGGLSVSWLQTASEAFDSGGCNDNLEAVITAVTELVDTHLLINELRAASAEVSALVGAAKSYSHLDSSPMGACDVNDLLESTISVMCASLNDTVIVRRDYAQDLPPLLCYAAELNQTWGNLLNNALEAIQASDTGNGEIEVRTLLVDPQTIRVEICDTGVGIDAAIRDRIFLPFFTTKAVGEGIGMGLDLAWRTIVGLHHGTIDVESQPGATCFTACLPVGYSGNSR